MKVLTKFEYKKLRNELMRLGNSLILESDINKKKILERQLMEVDNILTIRLKEDEQVKELIRGLK